MDLSRAQRCLPQPSWPLGCVFPLVGFTAPFPLPLFKGVTWLQKAFTNARQSLHRILHSHGEEIPRTVITTGDSPH